MKVIPRGKYILVKPEEEDSKINDAGLSMPSNEEAEDKARGEVIEVGDVKDIKKGDRVIYGVFAGEEIHIKKVVYKLLHEEDVIAFVV